MSNNQNLLEEFEWYDEVDRIDPFYGDPIELAALLKNAPSQYEYDWLLKCIRENSQFGRQIGIPQYMENKMTEYEWEEELQKAITNNDLGALEKIAGDASVPVAIRQKALAAISRIKAKRRPGNKITKSSAPSM